MSARKNELAEDASSHSPWSPFATVYDPRRVGHINGGGVAVSENPHDRGLIRALNATYKADKKLTSDPKRTVFVGRLKKTTTEKTLRSVFEKFGPIKSLRLVRDLVTGASRQYAFVEYVSRRDTERAFSGANREIIDGAKIFLDKEHERLLPGWVPRRLGGGFGGKKESGQLRFGCREKPWKRPR